MQFNNYLKKIVESASMARGITEVSVRANLAVGSPDIEPSKEIFNLLSSIKDFRKINYIPSKGSNKALENLHNVILDKFDKIDFKKNISLCNGAKFGVYLALKTIANPGDNVILLQPYWLSYPDICTSLGLYVNSMKLEISKLNYNSIELKEKLLLTKSKVLILNNPNNPGGFVLDDNFLNDIISFCKSNNIWILIDEVYKDMYFEKSVKLHRSIFDENVIRIGSVSKSLSIPGMRLGYVVGSSDFISKFNLFNQHISTCVNYISNYLIENLTKSTFDNYIDKTVMVYKNRANLIKQLLREKGYFFIDSCSSFYLLVDVSNKYRTSQECVSILEEKGIIVTNGKSYGTQFENYIRICLTLDENLLINVIKEFR